MGAKYKTATRQRAPALALKQPSPADLSAAEHDLIARRREDFITLMPDALPLFRELYEQGLIDGWRAIQWVRPLLPTDSKSPDTPSSSDTAPDIL